MPEQAAQSLRACEQRIDLQISRIEELERIGRWSDAERAREVLAVLTESRDALRLRVVVVSQVAATQAQAASRNGTHLPFLFPAGKPRRPAG